MANRYSQLLEIIDEIKPKHILEIGTWWGYNAQHMINAALKHHDKIVYTGYDLFDDGTEEIDKKELNVKRRSKIEKVRKNLQEQSGNVMIDLIRGNTNETLRGLDIVADFVFIDGGHSIETIANDYNAVKRSACIVLDDYYEPDSAGLCPDIGVFGCNKIVSGISHSVILPIGDEVKGGGITKMVLVKQ